MVKPGGVTCCRSLEGSLQPSQTLQDALFSRPILFLFCDGSCRAESPKRRERTGPLETKPGKAVGRMGKVAGGGSCTLWDSFRRG